MNDDGEPLGPCDICGKVAYDEWLNADGLLITTCRHHGNDRPTQTALRHHGFWLMATRKVPA